jgi:hypothetical protein
MTNKLKITIALTTIGLLAGCGTATGVHEKLPPANYVSLNEAKTGPIEIIRQGETPSRPTIRIANVAAHGNAYADLAKLEATLIREAESLNADCLYILGKEVTKDETIGSYGGGFFSSSQIHRPHLYGIACKYAKVRLGLKWDKDGIVEYVFSGSVAERAGIVEGQKILAINGQPFIYGSYLIEKEISSRNPGDRALIELLSKNGEKLKKDLVLEQ